MKKLTKRNRTHNRKVVFGYHDECDPGEVSDYTTVLTKKGGSFGQPAQPWIMVAATATSLTHK